MNARARISSKGQVVIPKKLRDAHGWSEGTELEFEDIGGEIVVRSAVKPDLRYPPISWAEFQKLRIKLERPFPTDEEIEETLLAEAGRRFDATRR